jgi:hypothetical protein
VRCRVYHVLGTTLIFKDPRPTKDEISGGEAS